MFKKQGQASRQANFMGIKLVKSQVKSVAQKIHQLSQNEMSTHLSGSVLSTFLTVLAVGEDDPSAAYLRKKYLYVSNLVFWSENKLPVT